MPEPISEQIMVNVRTRMDVVFDAFRSTRIATWQPKDLVTHITQGSLVANDAISLPGNPPAKGWTLQAIIAGVVKPSDRSTTAIDTFKNRLAADIIGALTNAALWHQWGGLAIDTEIKEAEDFTSAEWSGVIIRMDIHFRTDEDDLYVSRA